jgi:Zn-dependent M16 (insulinase) family peptidase
VISDLDSYELPDAKGYSAMLRNLIGETGERRQLVRDQVLATTERCFRDFADVIDAARDASYVVVMGSGKAIDKAKEELPFVVTQIL